MDYVLAHLWIQSITGMCGHRIFVSVPRTHGASWKGLLDGADPPSFNARVVDPTQSSQDMPVNLTMQLTTRESLLIIKGGTVPVLPDSPECAALRADMRGDRLNSGF